MRICDRKNPRIDGLIMIFFIFSLAVFPNAYLNNFIFFLARKNSLISDSF